MLMLTMDVGEHISEFLQLRHSTRLAINIARDLPSRVYIRLRIQFSSELKSLASSQVFAAFMVLISKVAVISARSLPCRMVSVSARSPNAILNASNTNDLPAPVSPVMAVVP